MWFQVKCLQVQFCFDEFFGCFGASAFVHQLLGVKPIFCFLPHQHPRAFQLWQNDWQVRQSYSCRPNVFIVRMQFTKNGNESNIIQRMIWSRKENFKYTFFDIIQSSVEQLTENGFHFKWAVKVLNWSEFNQLVVINHFVDVSFYWSWMNAINFNVFKIICSWKEFQFVTFSINSKNY